MLVTLDCFSQLPSSVGSESLRGAWFLVPGTFRVDKSLGKQAVAAAIVSAGVLLPLSIAGMYISLCADADLSIARHVYITLIPLHL